MSDLLDFYLDWERVPKKYKKKEKTKDVFEDGISPREMSKRYHYQDGFSDGMKYMRDILFQILHIQLKKMTGEDYQLAYLFQTAHHYIEQDDVEHYVDEECCIGDYDYVDALCKYLDMKTIEPKNKYYGDW